jgi:hypothetical protein
MLLWTPIGESMTSYVLLVSAQRFGTWSGERSEEDYRLKLAGQALQQDRTSAKQLKSIRVPKLHAIPWLELVVGC